MSDKYENHKSINDSSCENGHIRVGKISDKGDDDFWTCDICGAVIKKI